jgi:hypothetical protein
VKNKVLEKVTAKDLYEISLMSAKSKEKQIYIYEISNLSDIIGFKKAEILREEFLKNNCWYAIRISGGKLNEIKYIAAYQTAPVSAITHYAEVDTIEAYGDGRKYKLYFKGEPLAITPIPFGDAKTGSLQGPRYTTLEKMLKVKTVKELFE